METAIGLTILLLTLFGFWRLLYWMWKMVFGLSAPHRRALQNSCQVRPYILKAPPIAKPKSMARPTTRQFKFRDEYDSASARQRVLIRYEDYNGNETERKIEIYYPQEDEYVYAWCCLRREPRTFNRNNIREWQLLDECFDHDSVVAQYWSEEGMRDIKEKIPEMAPTTRS